MGVIVEGGKTEIVRLPYLPWQKNVREAVWDGVRTIVLACGIRSGKDRCSANVMIEVAIYLAVMRAIYEEQHPEEPRLVPRVNVWVIAPTKKLFKQNWDEVMAVIPKSMLIEANGKE